MDVDEVETANGPKGGVQIIPRVEDEEGVGVRRSRRSKGGGGGEGPQTPKPEGGEVVEVRVRYKGDPAGEYDAWVEAAPGKVPPEPKTLNPSTLNPEP